MKVNRCRVCHVLTIYFYLQYLLHLLFIMRAFHFCSGVSMYISTYYLYVNFTCNGVLCLLDVGDMPNKHKHKQVKQKKFRFPGASISSSFSSIAFSL